jgi:hypothetical protein
MNTNLKPQSTDKNITTTKPQIDKEQKMKSKISLIIWIVLILLAGSLWLTNRDFGFDMQGLAFCSLCTLVFCGIALKWKKNWWAIIPGGFFASIWLIIVLETLIPQEHYPVLPHTLHWGVYSWVLFLGLAVMFGVLWLLRKTQPTDWAKYPATGLAVIALQCFILGARFQETYLITMLVAIGAMLMLALLTRKHLPVAGEGR